MELGTVETSKDDVNEGNGEGEIILYACLLVVEYDLHGGIPF